MRFSQYVPTKIIFGAGSLDGFCKNQLPGKRALLVISAGHSAEKYGYLEKLTNQLDGMGIVWRIYDGIRQNPDTEQIMLGAAAAREYPCDFVIGLGGGSCMDAAKAIAVLAVNPGDIWDYMRCGSGRGRRTERTPLPVVTVPTSAGSSSAVDPWTTVVNRRTQEKEGYGYGETFPVLAVYDPEIMRSVPRKYTLYQSFDIFCHCFECYMSRHATAMSDMYAVRGLRLVGENLERVLKNGTDIQVRENMALADICAGFAMCSCPVISLHALEHILSAAHPELPHGAGLMLLFPFWLEQMEKHQEIQERLQALRMESGESCLGNIRKICEEYRGETGTELTGDYDAETYIRKAEERLSDIFEGDRVRLDVEQCREIFYRVQNVIYGEVVR